MPNEIARYEGNVKRLMFTCCSLTVCVCLRFASRGNFFKVIKRCIKWKSRESYHPSDFRFLLRLPAPFLFEFLALCWAKPWSESFTHCKVFMFAVRFIIVCISFTNEEKRLHFLSHAHIFSIVILQYYSFWNLLLLHLIQSLSLSFACLFCIYVSTIA